MSDYAKENFDLSETTLKQVGKELAGASPQVEKCFQIASGAVSNLPMQVASAEHYVDRWLNDNTVYPKGRYEQAAAELAKAEAGVQQNLAIAKLNAKAASKLLADEAMPRFEGDDMEQQRVREEIRDVVSRSTDPTTTLVKLSHDERYAALVASRFGRSLLLERGLDERGVERAYDYVRTEALGWIAENGSDAQKAAASRYMLGELMQGAVLPAELAVKSALDALSVKVRALGLRLSTEEAQRVREVGRANPRRAR
jgi:hypothetical protein